MSDHDHKEPCCDPCDKRMQGEQGPQGVQGAMGPAGLQGVQGVAGPQGMQGACVNCFDGHHHHKKMEFAEVYSLLSQTLSVSPGPNLPGQVVLFENTIAATANIDVSGAISSGTVIINEAGWYDVTVGICGSLNPIMSPLPVWTLSVFKNGVIVPGSTFSNMTLSAAQLATEMAADVFVHFAKGDSLLVANTSTNPVILAAQTLGTNASPTSAYLKISLLEAD